MVSNTKTKKEGNEKSKVPNELSFCDFIVINQLVVYIKNPLASWRLGGIS